MGIKIGDILKGVVGTVLKATPLGPIVGLVEGVAGAIGSDKVSDVAAVLRGEKDISPEQEQAMADSLRVFTKQNDEFFLDYEGRAKNIPRSMQILRASVRPVLTYMTFIMFYVVIVLFFFAVMPEGRDPELAVKMVAGLTGIVGGFWFYGRQQQKMKNGEGGAFSSITNLFSKK